MDRIIANSPKYQIIEHYLILIQKINLTNNTAAKLLMAYGSILL